MMQMFTVPYVVYSLTHSTIWLGVSAAVAFAPGVVVGPIGGALADRYSRRRVLLVTQSLAMVSAFVLWILWDTGSATVVNLLLTVLLGTAAGGLGIGSWQAYVPELVPKADLMNAVRLNSIQFNVARAVGPLAAALVLARLGPGAAFIGNALSFVPVVAVLVVLPDTVPHRSAVRSSMVREFGDGLRYIRRHRALVECALNSLVLATLAYAIVQLAPAIAHQQLHVGKAGYGLLVSAWGVGSIITSFVMAARADWLPRSRIALAGIVAAVVGMGLLGVAPPYWLGLLAFFVIGVAQTSSGITYMTTIQVQVADAYRGRVIANYITIIQLGFPLGALIEGSVASVTGTRVLALGSAVLLLAYFGLVLLRFRGLRDLDDNSQLQLTGPMAVEAAG
jgi:MFS family permease